MTDYSLEQLAARLDALIDQCQTLRRDNQELRDREQTWLQERARLIEKNDLARNRVESMIDRLKNLKEGAG